VARTGRQNANKLQDFTFEIAQMKSFSIVTTTVLLIALSSGGSSSVGPKQEMFQFNYENIIGTSLELKVLAPSRARAELAESAALNEIDRQAKILSGYDASSEFSTWFRTSGQPVAVSPELFEVLDLFDRWRDRTHGALDASAETVTRAWKKAAAERRMPTAAELAAAVATVNQRHWSINRDAQTASHLSTAPLMLNSFAKSYIVNSAARAAMGTPDVTGVVVNIGGDLVVRGSLTEPVDIADPFSDAENNDPVASLTIHDRAVATSGDYRRGVEIGGRHYSHIVDPRTGQPAEEIVSSTVVAQNPADAGALATAFSVMKPEESARLAASMPGVDYLLIKANGERVASAGWLAMAVTHPRVSLMPAAAAAGEWDPSMELTVAVDIQRIEGNRAKRPYLAVWIEDQDHFPVRTIALWMEKPKYLNEMTAWYKDDRMRAMAEGKDITRSVSSATRPPGKYTLKWDGKDNGGKTVKAGKYTVMIEATREHGTDQIMHQEFDFTGTPKQVALPGGIEIAGATLDYHKVGH
jgi:thiamine biosynthesis lipoprotein